MKKMNPLYLLTRSDKWYLGGGNRLLWAPPFPAYLDSPGFWDEAQYFNYELRPLFTWTLLDDAGREVSLKFVRRTWDPSCLIQEYHAELADRKTRFRLMETRSLLSNDVATSVVRLKNGSRKMIRLHLILWTVQDHFPSKESAWLANVSEQNGVLSFRKYLRPSVDPHVEIACALGMNMKVRSFSMNLSERTSTQPQWSLTPWFEKFTNGKLPNEVKLTGVSNEGLMYLALATQISLQPGKEVNVALGYAASPSNEESRSNLRAALRRADPVKLSKLSWTDHFNSVPYFECSDEFFTRYYWYRWYGLKLNTQYGNDGNYRRPFVSEGVGYFRAPISYSAPCHMLENRWMHEPELARGSLLTFIDNQRDDGGFRGYIDMNHNRQDMFYHANWGSALLALHAIHPDLGFLDSIYDGLKKYVSYFDRERDEEVSGLYDIDNHYETGQEFMHRYTVVNPEADKENWGEVFRLKGVDVTVYIYELKRALSNLADKLGKTDDADLWRIEAERIRNALCEKMWDPKDEMFFDIDPKAGERTMVKSATCFYPYFTDIVNTTHLNGLKRHLFSRKEFWTPFPVPSSSADDEFFCAEPEWKGKRMNCPWNGRVWPMTNSHIAEALATSAINFSDGVLRRKAAEFITKFVRMMFFDGDPRRPNCFEHYNPLTGKPSLYRGIDDYQHSWINDLIIKYVCGIRPSEFSVIVDPFPFNFKRVVIDDVLIRGHLFRVEIWGKRFIVILDGKQHAESVIGKPIQVQV